MDTLESDLIRQALDRSAGNAQRAAKLLGLEQDWFDARVRRLGL